MFDTLRQINLRPKPFQYYTAQELWDDDYTSSRMLECHLREGQDLASRRWAFIDDSVAWMTTRFDIGAHTRIADFGCGPGLYANRLARCGARVTGIDFSRRSIAYAREMAQRDQLDIDYVHQNYLEFEPENRFDLILMIYCDFCALSPQQRATMLGKFRSLLNDRGHIVLDVCSLRAFYDKTECATYERRSLDGFWSAGDYFGFQNTFLYEPEKLILEKYTIVEAERTREIFNWLQCFSEESIREEFEAGGLKVIETYSDVAGDPFQDDAPEMAIVAVKQ